MRSKEKGAAGPSVVGREGCDGLGKKGKREIGREMGR